MGRIVKLSKAVIAEIFTSIQGEGLYAGQKQVFVRFAGCDLGCSYCDEPAAKRAGKELPLSAIRKAIRKMVLTERVRAVSFTGGEPLLQHSALLKLALYAKSLGLEVHLETNGTRYKELAEVIGAVDVVAADIKLPGTSGKALWAEHKKFLASAGSKAFIKTVVTSETSLAEFRKAVELAAEASAFIPFFIQPVTPTGRLKPPGRARLDVFYQIASEKLKAVRVLPQLHKLWKIK